MARRPFITSNANDRLKAVRRLARRRDRDLFVIEGHRQLAAALAARARVCEVYVSPPLFLGGRDAELVALAEQRGATVVELGPAAFRSISGQVRPDGVLAVVERWATSLAPLDLGIRPLLLVAVGIERPGNLGTIIRTACSAGATALLACDQRSDVFHPEAVRGSVGTLFHLPIAQCPSEDAISWLGEQGVAVVVATPHAARPHWTGDYAEAVALVVGSERHGVPNAWLAAADAAVTIPMPGSADSLNVAVAAGVVLFEAVRQRLGAAGTDPLRGSVHGPATPWRATSPSRAAPRSA